MKTGKEAKRLRDRLMARTCELILTEGQFNMTTFNGRTKPDRHGDNVERTHPRCGTACCIAGNLDIALREAGIKIRIPRESPAERSEFRAEKAWKEWLHDNGTDFMAVGLSFCDVTPVLAVANVMTGRKLHDLSLDPAAVDKAVRAARRLIKKVAAEKAK